MRLYATKSNGTTEYWYRGVIITKTDGDPTVCVRYIIKGIGGDPNENCVSYELSLKSAIKFVDSCIEDIDPIIRNPKARYMVATI